MRLIRSRTEQKILIVEAAHDRTRLDQCVAAALAPEHSRSQVARMIKAGLVTVNGATPRASSVLRRGDRIAIAEPSPIVPAATPETAPAIEIIYDDAELIVVNKPAGMTVHQAPGHPHSTLVDALLARFPELARMAEPDGVMRPGIVHRLDKDTSGVMIVARTPFARTALSKQFKDRTVRKLYLAIVRGVVARDQITITRSLGRHPTERKRMSIRSRNPRDAVSHLTVLHRFADATLVGVRPETGRTHQIRVHLASIGHGCLGDTLYGGRDAQPSIIARQALHAYALAVDHPRTGQRLAFRAPLAVDMADYLRACGLEVFGGMVDQWVAELSKPAE
jgi:23S rRNA pseudouridine1911/1915/1917 synthase